MWIPQEALQDAVQQASQPDSGRFYEIVWAAVATALSTVFGVLVAMMRGRIADLKERARVAEERADNLQSALNECYEGHQHGEKAADHPGRD